MGAQEGLILIAREQTAGRGRLARSWESPRGGLYLSLLLRPPIPLARAQQVTMLASLAAIDACQAIAGVTPRPKWPNDLLLKDKKLAGTLTELASDGSRLRYAIIGLGLNVNNAFEDGPLADSALSLRMATGRTYDIPALADAFIRVGRALRGAARGRVPASCLGARAGAAGSTGEGASPGQGDAGGPGRGCLARRGAAGAG